MANEDKTPAAKSETIEPFKPKKSIGKKLLVILLLVLLVGGGFAGGWFLQQSKINKLQNEKAAAEEKAKQAGEKSSEAEREVVRVQVARAADSSFNVEVPIDWLTGTCGESLVFVANTAQRLGKCNSEYFGMMSFSSSAGDTREPVSTYTSSADYADFRSEAVNINGVAGDKLTYRFVGESIVGYPDTGSTFIVYRLFDGTKTYIANYDRISGEADYSAEFNAMVATLDTTP